MKQLMKWNEKKKYKLKVFVKLQMRDGSVKMKDLANELGEIVATTYLWRKYCIENGIIDESVMDSGLYEITEFGKTLIGGKNA